MKRYLIAGVLASAAVAGLPSVAHGRADLPASTTYYAASGDSIADLRAQLADLDRQEREAQDEFNRARNASGNKTKGAQNAKAKLDNRLREINQRRNQLKNQVQRATAGDGAKQAFQEKLDNANEAAAAERKRHAERMKNLPKGSAAAAAEEERFQERMREITGKRDDLKESRQDVRDLKQSKEQYQKDTQRLKQELAAEDERHKKAMKFLPAYSEAAQEEQRLHEQKRREIEQRQGLAADRRDLTVVDKQAKREFDADADATNAAIKEEQARHARRVQEVNAGSAAAVEEERQHQYRMAELTGRRDSIASASDGASTARGSAILLRQQIAEQEKAMDAENARHARMLNLVEAGSASDAAERERHARIAGQIASRKADLQSQLAAAEGNGASASGR